MLGFRARWSRPAGSAAWEHGGSVACLVPWRLHRARHRLKRAFIDRKLRSCSTSRSKQLESRFPHTVSRCDRCPPPWKKLTRRNSTRSLPGVQTGAGARTAPVPPAAAQPCVGQRTANMGDQIIFLEKYIDSE